MYTNVFIIVVLQAIVKREGASEAVVQEDSLPLQLLLQRFVFSSPGNSGERLEEKKGMIVLLGATGPL